LSLYLVCVFSLVFRRICRQKRILKFGLLADEFCSYFFDGLLVHLNAFFLEFALFPQLFPYVAFLFIDLLVFLLTALLETLNLQILFCFALFCLQCLAHAVSDRTLIERLVRLNCHLDFVPYPDEQEASFSTVNSDLPDKFVKRLRVQLLANRTNACFSCLSFLKSLV